MLNIDRLEGSFTETVGAFRRRARWLSIGLAAYFAIFAVLYGIGAALFLEGLDTVYFVYGGTLTGFMCVEIHFDQSNQLIQRRAIVFVIYAIAGGRLYRRVRHSGLAPAARQRYLTKVRVVATCV